MSCQKRIFKKDEHSGELNFNVLKGGTLEEVLAEIETMLRKVKFSTSLDLAKEPDLYQLSVDDLIDTIIEKLEAKDLPFQINRNAKTQIKKYFRGKLLPKPLTPVEKDIQEVIPGIELISEDERRSKKLKSILSEIYKDNDAINAFRQSEFNEQMRIRTIIDTESRTIVDTPKAFNRALIKYLISQFRILRDFILDLGFDKELLPQCLYRTAKNVGIENENDLNDAEGIPNLVRTYNNILQIMYNIIHDKKNKKILDSELIDGWINAVNRPRTEEERRKAKFYEAVNAYVNLAYFDDVLEECFGDFININRNYDQPITLEIDNGKSRVIYKYTFERGNSNNVKGFDEEAPDALKKMSKFQQVIISGIPVYDDYKNPASSSYIRMLPKDFVGSFSKLLDEGTKVTDTKFVEAIRNFKKRPLESAESILRRLFAKTTNGKTNYNAKLINELDELGVDQNAMDYLYSVYRTVFEGKHSWKSIEDDYTKDNGYTSRYFLIHTLLGVMDSNVAMNYAQTTYNHDTGKYETGVKARYATNRTKFDIVNNVNGTTIDREDKLDKLNRYNLTWDKKDYSITLNNAGEPITFKLITKKNSGILDKGLNSNNIDIQGLSTFEDIDLSSEENRRRLASGQGLTAEEHAFMTILGFVDDMLETYFSRDKEGLKELKVFLGVNKNGIKELFTSAARALVVTDIYNKFENAKKPNGEKYSKVELTQFLSDHDVYVHKIQEKNEKDKRQYFIKRYDGYQLNTLRASQKWVDDLAKARAILSGDTSKSVISNLDGDKIPNFSPGFLGANISLQLAKSNELGLASAHLLFAQNQAAIKAKTVNTDVITKDGIKKQVKSMTNGELLYDAIVNKFIVPFLDSNSVYTQPTTFSDKTKFILYQVSLETLRINDIVADSFNEVMEGKIIETIGKAYGEVYNQVVQDYAKIFPEFIMNGVLDMDAVQNWMKKHKESDLIKEANKVNVTVYRDVHYRQTLGKALSINELLYEYANNLYTPENLHERLEYEKINFINDLLANRLSFEVNLNNNGELDAMEGNEMTRILFKTIKNKKAKEWVKGNRLILAKVKSKNGIVQNITYGKVDLKEGDIFEINPVLNAFFMLDNLIGNNLRYSLTGSEINHKVKALAKLDLGAKGLNLHKDFIKKYNPNYDMGKITFYDILAALKNYDRVNNEEDRSTAEFVRRVYKEQIYKIENGAQNAQFKRNVIIPGTMRYYLQGTLNGIGSEMKVAVIDDMNAKVFNFDGKSDGVDAHDGSAFVNPISSLLENWSLQDCEVGTVKKPIQHWYDDRYMSATLLKYAVDTITNQWMRQAEGNDPAAAQHGVILRNIFKKMTNLRWHNPDGSWKYGEIDLISGCDYRHKSKINFSKHILEGKGLFYRDGLDDKQIFDFGLENGVYYTIERDVDPMGLNPKNPTKYYHYFTADSTHVKSEVMLDHNARNLHTIDSLFELHTALGGIYSVSHDEEGYLQPSESSNVAVARFVNNVAILKPGLDKETAPLTQESYYQPLKHAMIDVLANNSAVKNGAGNVNPTSSFFDNSELRYMTIGTDGYGIQMDADHTMDEAQMTEFSQVISSLDAGGRMHNYVSQIYLTLGQLALDLSKVELDAIKHFRNTGNKTKVYDIVGRTIMNNLSRNKGTAGLASAIVDSIQELFNLNTDHELDELKIPFSDPNIYSTILATFVSVINKKSIKRRYPGNGTVMVPGYNLSMVYDLDGKTYQFEDLIKMATLAGFKSRHTDLSLKNRDIVQLFLEAKQAELPVYDNSEVFLPTENVIITCDGETFNTNALDSNLVEWEVIDKEWKEKEDKSHLNPDGTVKSNKALNIYLKGQKELGHFLLVKDNEWGNYSIHFKTNNGRFGDLDVLPSTRELRNVLYQQLYNAIPDGALVSTYGDISIGGVAGLNKLMTEVGNSTVGNVVGTRVLRTKEGLQPIEIPIYLKVGSGMLYENNVRHTVEVSLNEISDYYKFKDDIQGFLAERGIFNATNITYLKNVKAPRNLAPVKILWSYEDETGPHTMNIFDHWRIKGLFKEIEKINALKDAKKISSKQAKAREKAAREKYDVQQAFNELHDKKYFRGPDDEVGVAVFHMKNGKRVDGVSNLAAELIISNLYKSKFGIKNGDSLADVIDAGPKYFKRSVVPIMSDSYDLVYTKQDNRNLYITFKPLRSNDDNFDSTKRSWPNKIKEDFVYPEGYEGEKTIVTRVYTATKDNIPLFEVGREIVRKDVIYDTKLKKFTKDGKVLSNLSRFSRMVEKGNVKVIEYVEFISNNLVTEIGEKTSKYDLYNINTEVLARLMHLRDYTKEELTREDDNGNTYTITPEQKFEEEVNSYISHLLAAIYHTQDFNGMLVNSTVSVQSNQILLKTLHNLSNQLSYDPDLSAYVKDLLDITQTGNFKDGKVNHTPRKINKALNKYNEKLSHKLYVSFLKALEFTASRIPAQTLQSFMQMRCVGFTGTTTNQCMVSHWQTWLQGSDYDIDKAYIMGLSFDGNGKYVGWSTLFNYSSIESLKESEYLPMPKKKVYKIVEGGTNIDSYISAIEKAMIKNDTESEVRAYVKLLNYLNENEISEITYTYKDEAMQKSRRAIILKIMDHEFTKIPYSLQEDASKNFVSSHILNTVQDLRNMVGAYSPIEMEAFREASESSPKGEQASQMTLLNPATKLLMQYQNITGKNVIGIAANGEKASFMWHYYINDIVRLANSAFNSRKYLDNLNAEIAKASLASGVAYGNLDVHLYLADSNYRDRVKNIYKDIIESLPTLQKLDAIAEKIKYSLFNFSSSRIKGRNSGNITPQQVNTLPDIFFDDKYISPKLRQLYGVRLRGDITVDLMISQILSAATDNAKELILAKVNAGSKLAKVHLFLVTLGFDINDIVKFMTSPAITFIDTMTESNIFTGQEMKMDKAIKLAKGNFDGFYKDFLSTRTLGLLEPDEKDKLNNGELITNRFDTGSKEYIELENALAAIGEVKYLLQLAIENTVQAEAKNNKNKSVDLIREEVLVSIPLDVEEFENVLEGAEEFSNFGKILGANQGLATSKTDQQGMVQAIQTILSSRIQAVNKKANEDNQVEEVILDVKRYLRDEEYAKQIRELYDSVKKCVNIFDAIDHIPQFRSIFQIFSMVLDVDHNISIKTRAYDYVYDYLKSLKMYMSEEYLSRLLKGIDDAIIAKFINLSNISIPFKAGTTALDDVRQTYQTAKEGMLTFDLLSDVASFKYYFENSIIPRLKEGYILKKRKNKIEGDGIDSEWYYLKDPAISNNRFIQSLIRGEDKGVPLYKCDLDMLTIENSLNSRIKFQEYVRGLLSLKGTKINGVDLADLFVLYNLVVNKNRYGSDKMTTLFDSFIKDIGELSLINDYLNFVGNLDYSGNIELLNLNVLDLMRSAAAIVNSEVGLKDPTIIVNTDYGPELRIKSGGQYVKWTELIPTVPGESLDKYLERIHNHNSYFVLGGSYSDAVDRLVSGLRYMSTQSLDIINNLVRQGTLTIYKVCK